MTAALPWTSVGVATGYRGNPRVSTARATAHGASTANATVVTTARATVRSEANSVAPTMATHGSPRRLPRQFPQMSNHSNFPGYQRQLSRQSSDTWHLPRKLAAVATTISADVKPRQFSRPSAVILRYWAIATEVIIARAISTAFRGHRRQLKCRVHRRQFPCNHCSCNGNPRKFPRQAAGCHGDHGKARTVRSLSICITKSKSKRLTWYRLRVLE